MQSCLDSKQRQIKECRGFSSLNTVLDFLSKFGVESNVTLALPPRSLFENVAGGEGGGVEVEAHCGVDVGGAANTVNPQGIIHVADRVMWQRSFARHFHGIFFDFTGLIRPLRPGVADLFQAAI